jgi:hypothetical protein
VIEDFQHFISGGRAGNFAGPVIAKVLTGAWRSAPDAHDLSEAELSLVVPLLYQSGEAALAWWRIHSSVLATSSMGGLLHDAYRHLRLAARAHEREIKHVISLLRAEGIEPVLVKGWAIARLYPDVGLRPYGDIDLCVRPDQVKRAQRVLERLAKVAEHFVDLHDGFAKLNLERSDLSPVLSEALWNELCQRSRLADLGEEKIRVLSDEDHLRVLCLHLLRSGAWRPLWLCDVALAVESRGPDFNWDVCLSRDQLKTDWIACTIGLAHQLLGVDVEDTPVSERAKRLPRWLVPAVLRQWSLCRNPDAVGMALPTLLHALAEPRKIFRELYARCDQPVRATITLRGRFNDWPRSPYQLAELIKRSPELPRQLALMSRQFFRPTPSNDLRSDLVSNKTFGLTSDF